MKEVTLLWLVTGWEPSFNESSFTSSQFHFQRARRLCDPTRDIKQHSEDSTPDFSASLFVKPNNFQNLNLNRGALEYNLWARRSQTMTCNGK